MSTTQDNGATISRRAHACPECGADERTGWRETSLYDGLDLPDAAFEHEPPPSSPWQAPSWWWPAVGMLLLVALVAVFVFRP